MGNSVRIYANDVEEVYSELKNYSEWTLAGNSTILTGSDSSGPYSVIRSGSVPFDFIEEAYHMSATTKMIEVDSFSSLYFTLIVNAEEANDVHLMDNQFTIHQEFYNDTNNKIYESKVFESNTYMPWKSFGPIKLYSGKFKLRFTYRGLISTKFCAFGFSKITKSKKINCEVVEYNPPEPITRLNEIQLLRGLNKYNQIKQMGVLFKLVIMFSDYRSQAEFIKYAFSKSIMIIDKDGLIYRGFIDSASFRGKYFGDTSSGVFYRDVTIKCPQEIGVGW